MHQVNASHDQRHGEYFTVARYVLRMRGNVTSFNWKLTDNVLDLFQPDGQPGLQRLHQVFNAYAHNTVNVFDGLHHVSMCIAHVRQHDHFKLKADQPGLHHLHQVCNAQAQKFSYVLAGLQVDLDDRVCIRFVMRKRRNTVNVLAGIQVDLDDSACIRCIL
jgi:hypothetical protein